MKNESIARLQNEYLEKLYFFALKKTGNKQEAEDLAQEIATQALISLSNGCCPDEFGHWLWGIARKRYARWADRKSKLNRMTSRNAAAADEVPDHDAWVEDQIIHGESMVLLQRELSLLSSSYRDITVAYYIRGEKIKDISEKLRLPEGTIKRRLHESRQNLKEGLNMAREKGTRSYLAENISFVMSGSPGKDGSPWSLIERRIPKNILLEAYRNPVTLEELCMGLGIAMPYMEEEVKLLTEGTLLKEVGKGIFETDFIIIDKDMQTDIFKTMELSEAFCPKLLEQLDDMLEDIRSIGFIGSDQPTEELYWLMIPLIVDRLCQIIGSRKEVPNGYTNVRAKGDGILPVSRIANFLLTRLSVTTALAIKRILGFGLIKSG